MRYRIKDYTAYQGIGIANEAPGGAYFPIHIVADCGTDLTNFTTRQLIESVLLVFNETTGTLYTSTKKKARIQGVSVQDTTKLNMWFKSTDLDVQPNLEVGGPLLFNTPITDDFRIEIDLGGSVDLTDIAKQGENQEATNSAILSALNSVATSMYKGVPIVSQTGDATIAPNVLNVWGEVTSLNITKGNDIEGITNLYLIRFVAGEALQVSFTGFDLLWYGGSVPTWNAGSTYEINIIDNLALWAEFIPA